MYERKFCCRDCGYEFETPRSVSTTYESYYGVGGLFQNHHSMTYETCPCCSSENFEEIYPNFNIVVYDVSKEDKDTKFMYQILLGKEVIQKGIETIQDSKDFDFDDVQAYAEDNLFDILEVQEF